MRDEKRLTRKREIEEHAYALFAEVGFESASMLAVAKRARASNETMYRWYGDKDGLFASMVEGNAAKVRDALAEVAEEGAPPMEALAKVAVVLLGMLLSDRAILLNRAAASDPTGGLGVLLSKGGREDVMPMIAGLLRKAVAMGTLKEPQVGGAGPLFLRLLVGGQQIRRVIGTMAAPSENEIEVQARIAMAQFTALCTV